MQPLSGKRIKYTLEAWTKIKPITTSLLLGTKETSTRPTNGVLKGWTTNYENKFYLMWKHSFDKVKYYENFIDTL